MSYPIFHSQYTAAQIEGTIGKSPRIDPVTKHWEVWDIASGAYIDTGVDADAQDAADRAEAAATTATDAKDDAVDAKTDAVNAADRAEAAAATLTVDAAISDSSTNPVQNKVIAAALDEKLNVDGYSALATVGNAEQLVSTLRVTDAAPYLFRTAGGAADIGNREYDKLIGGTVAWNQLLQDYSNVTSWNVGLAAISVSDGIATIRASAQDQGRGIVAHVIVGHKYLVWADIKLTTATTAVALRVFGVNYPTVATTNWQNIARIVTADSTTSTAMVIRDTRASDWDDISAKNFVCFDLTQMFGSTIADHIYTLETAEAGSGIAWLRSYGFFTKPYYPYNAGALASVEATAHETVEFNQWDEEWEQGTINNDGTTGLSSVMIRSKNFSPCIPGKEYCFTKPANIYFQIFWYDANQTFIKRNYFEVTAYAVYTVPDDAAYFKITLGNNSNPITAYANNICVNLSWSGYRNGEYRPFVKHTYPLDDSLTLRGRLVLDADGGLYYDGDTYAADGTVERKYGTVDLGTLTWTYFNADNGQSYFISNVQGVMKAPATDDDLAGILPARALTVVSGTEMYSTYPDRTIAMQAMDGTITQGYLWIRWSELSDPADLVTALSGVMLSYPLATPTTEEAAPFQSPQIVDDFGTERYVVTPQDGFEMPVGHVTEYPANLRDKLQHLPDLADTDGAYAIQQTGTQMSLTPLASAVPSIYDLLDSNPIAHRTIYRGKNLGSTFTAAQKATIAAGEFHDIWLGDYWVINSVTYVVADFDYWLKCGDTEFNKHHVVVMPAANMYSAAMNDSATTRGGYYGSKMRGVEVDGVFTPYAQGCGLYNALTAFQTAFGDALLTHREYLSNAVADGKESAGAWYDSIIDLPSEIMMYGTSIRTPTPKIQTINKSRLALMAASPNFIFPSRATTWLRDVVSSSAFACMNSYGSANADGAAYSLGVRPVAAIGG